MKMELKKIKMKININNSVIGNSELQKKKKKKESIAKIDFNSMSSNEQTNENIWIEQMNLRKPKFIYCFEFELAYNN